MQYHTSGRNVGEPEAMDLDDDEGGDASIEKSTSSSDLVNSYKKLLSVSRAKTIVFTITRELYPDQINSNRTLGNTAVIEREFWAHLDI
jgi:hypothetical protein